MSWFSSPSKSWTLAPTLVSHFCVSRFLFASHRYAVGGREYAAYSYDSAYGMDRSLLAPFAMDDISYSFYGWPSLFRFYAYDTLVSK
ncbi:hypothetical protein M408DRAFT_296722 [Serendipita vermifera MAFF 305830]|uniref:Uncharacterized protein n=1 Tax=Serendipita vermifera MAFF 305830 TaxID=933852 RepID=A0A0C3BDU8_SERVB|nr:hypothetical protein M408DRAFT_296722 [Serendipita vermifera MAFF 305830]